MSKTPKHCDDYIDDEATPLAVRTFLKVARAPAHGMLLRCQDNYPKLFATVKKGENKGKRVRIVMASRLGDVGYTLDLTKDIGYSNRVHLEDLTDFGDAP
jgi:hypothetical protein